MIVNQHLQKLLARVIESDPLAEYTAIATTCAVGRTDRGSKKKSPKSRKGQEAKGGQGRRLGAQLRGLEETISLYDSPD